ncbi:glycoside hydrolase family 2 protein [Williamsia maris]|uniref:beta-mannosidase n=1 Tax=Williamsia maris TaxID=72806 RepID=A0ABT1HF14_9NOCA|nr:glycoside hydrolase family 2 protein [Williamsia maris]MCP2176522.1 beta-mannosidase [Williamsia maris]
MDTATLVACEPDAFEKPADLTADVLAGGLEVDGPGLVTDVSGWQALVGPGRTVDDLDWWLVADLDHDHPVRIRFDGITFPATVFVDGEVAAQIESMFLPQSVAVTAGPHRVVIRFGSLTRWLARRRPRGRWRSSLVAAQGLRWARTTLLGRAPVYAGSPPPVGLWKPVTIERDATVDGLRVEVDVSRATVTSTGRCVDVTGAEVDGRRVSAQLTDPSGNVVATGSTIGADGGRFSLSLTVAEPQLWWPNGYGPQPLYRMTLTLGDTAVIRTVAFRTLGADRAGGGFRVVVNDTRIFCRGAVWTAVDGVGTHADTDLVRARLATLADAGATMVRLPGGLLYEGSAFWEACAHLGLLVWQDAMVATFDPPADLDATTRLELETVLAQVGGNPSMAVVSGGSETVQQPVMLGLPASERSLPLIETVLSAAAIDAGIPYVESSPSAPADTDDFPLRADTGISHWFGVGGYRRPIHDVVTSGVRFAAEALAFAIPPSPAAVERHFGSALVAGHDPVWKAGVPRDRGSSWDFEDVRDVYVEEVFGVDPAAVRGRDPERYLQLGRIAVGEAMSRCFTQWRNDPACGGALVLAASDLAPGAGWGLIDVDGEAKLPLAMVARTWASVALFVRDGGLDGVLVDAVNDGPSPLVGQITLYAARDGGAMVASGTRAVSIPARGSISLRDSEITGVFRDLSDAYRFGPRTADAVEAVLTVGSEVRAREVLCVRPGAPTTSADPPTASAYPVAGGWELEITASVALRWVEIDCKDFVPGDNVFHLVPGRPYRVALRSDDADRTPRGRLTTPDHPAPITIEVRT